MDGDDRGDMSTPGYHWNGTEVDLDAYLSRIGYTGERVPTVRTLRELHRRHTTTIPFENFEIILGRGIPLDLETVQDKLIRRRRGGYCYEHVTLFAAVLERLGFGVTGFVGRVVMGALGALRPATHALLRVTTADDDRIWLCDVGFGSGPLEPYQLYDDIREFRSGDWRFRLELTKGQLGEELWLLHQFGEDGWIVRYTFTTTPQYPIDYVVGNHYVSTSPRSPFTTRPYAQRFHPDRHVVVDGTTLTTRFPDGSAETTTIDPADLPKILNESFDIELDATDVAALTQRWLIPK